MCLLYRKNAEKTKSKPVRFEFGRKNKGAKYSFRRQAETERCELVLTWPDCPKSERKWREYGIIEREGGGEDEVHGEESSLADQFSAGERGGLHQ